MDFLTKKDSDDEDDEDLTGISVTENESIAGNWTKNRNLSIRKIEEGENSDEDIFLTESETRLADAL